MTNEALLAALGKLRGQVAQMTPEPWAALPHGSKKWVTNPSTTDDEWRDNRDNDADGIAVLRNAADELLAAAEALHRCSLAELLDVEDGTGICNCVECEAKKAAHAALDRLAKKLEAQ